MQIKQKTENQNCFWNTRGWPCLHKQGSVSASPISRKYTDPPQPPGDENGEYFKEYWSLKASVTRASYIISRRRLQ
jgi:hypothetical protein